jgi:hypothetical protein
MVCGGAPLAAQPPAIQKVEAQEKRLLVNGRVFLPLGIYHASNYHKGLVASGEAGFNTAQVFGKDPEELRKDLDEAYANGMYGTVALNENICLDLKRLEAFVRGNKDHPGLLAWMLQDEPNLRVRKPESNNEEVYRTPPEQLKPAYDLIRQIDPNHPVWLNLAHGYLADYQAYAPVCDILSADIYPVPSAPLTSVAAYADNLRKAVGPQKPIVLVLQMAPSEAKQARVPTMEEVRCMTYLALTHDVCGVMYYAYQSVHFHVERDAPDYWSQWADLLAELRTLAPLLKGKPIAEPVEVTVTKGFAGKRAWNYTALHTTLLKTSRGYLLLAVNGFPEAIEARLKLPVALPEKQRATVRFASRSVLLQQGALSDRFAPYAAHVYEIRP